MVDVVSIASYISERYLKEYGERIDEMKLHKLLYLTQRECLIQTGEPMFEATFHAWKYGPVLPEVYDNYKKYRRRDINTAGIKDDVVLEPQSAALFDKVYLEYSRYSAVALMQMTHEAGPWPHHQVGEILPKKEIRDYFLTLRLPNQARTEERGTAFDEAYMQRLIQLSAPAWKGVSDADAWVHELRGV